MAKNWYVIHTQTGYEDRVRTVLEDKEIMAVQIVRLLLMEVAEVEVLDQLVYLVRLE